MTQRERQLELSHWYSCGSWLQGGSLWKLPFGTRIRGDIPGSHRSSPPEGTCFGASL